MKSLEQYQDIYNPNGTNSAPNSGTKGIRECASRYKKLKPILKQFNRPFTVLDIGANLGYFSFRIAEDFPEAICVMSEGIYSDWLLKLAATNAMENVTLLGTPLNVESLTRLAECEHFDVVLALNVIHHMPDPEKCMSLIEQLGDITIVETPDYLDEGACGQERLEFIYKNLESSYKKLGSFTRHTSNHKSLMASQAAKKTYINRRYWDYSSAEENLATLDSSFDKKVITLNKKKVSYNFIPGINLRTFEYLKGMYPARADLVKSLDKFKDSRHTDLTPWNIILSGTDLSLIDEEDPHHIQISSTAEYLARTKASVSNLGMPLTVQEFTSL